MARGVVATAACVLLTGCGAGDGPDDGPGDGDRITPSAIAAIAQGHVALEPTRASEAGAFTSADGEESPAARLSYADVSLTVFVVPNASDPLTCADQSFFDACVDDSVDGHEVTIGWRQLEPEDPGVVYVVDRRAGEDVAVGVSGPEITGDPRGLDLGVPLADLAAIVSDPRLTLTPSR